MIKACIFDLDGTLADTLYSIRNCCNRCLEEVGLPVHSKEAYQKFIGNGAKKQCERAVRAAGCEDETIIRKVYERYMVLFQDMCTDEVVPYEGMLKTLQELRNRNIRLAVLSNKPHPMTVKVIREVFGEDAFSYVLGQKEEIPKKPDPTGAWMITEAFGVKPEECLYIGDSDADMHTGKNAKMFTVGACWGFRGEEELRENGADFLAHDPEEILDGLAAAER